MTIGGNYAYTMPQGAYGVAADMTNRIEPVTYTDRIKEVQEQIDNLRGQLLYALDEIEKLKSPVHFESLL